MSVGQDELLYQSSVGGSSSGGARSGVPYSNAKGAFFPNIPDVDRLAGGIVVRKWFLFNDSPVDALISPSVWIQSEPRYMVEHIGLGFDSASDNDAAQGNMTAFAASAVVAVQSSASDSRTATVYGLDSVGDPTIESIILNGTFEVLGLVEFSVVYAVMLSTTDAGLTVTVREGTGGTSRGVIGTSKKCCWLWIETVSKGSGIHLGNLASQAAYGFWDRISWDPNTPGVRPNISTIAVEEN